MRLFIGLILYESLAVLQIVGDLKEVVVIRVPVKSESSRQHRRCRAGSKVSVIKKAWERRKRCVRAGVGSIKEVIGAAGCSTAFAKVIRIALINKDVKIHIVPGNNCIIVTPIDCFILSVISKCSLRLPCKVLRL